MVASVVVDLKIAAGGGQRWCWGGADGGGVGRLGFGGGLLQSSLFLFVGFELERKLKSDFEFFF